MADADKYVTISCIIMKDPTAKAVLIRGIDGDAEVWVPRSLIHGADETALDKFEIGQEIELRIFEWAARDRGLI